MDQFIENNGQKLRIKFRHCHQGSSAFKEMTQEQWYDALTVEIQENQRFALFYKQIKTIPHSFLKGVTTCFIEDENGEVVSVGYAFCSERDNYNKSIGRQIAQNRAVKELSSKKKTIIWEVNAT